MNREWQTAMNTDWRRRLRSLNDRLAAFARCVGYVGCAAGSKQQAETRPSGPARPRQLFDRMLVAFDIETIPDPDIGRRLLELSGSDTEVVHEMVKRRLEETDGRTEYPHLPWHRVVRLCVCTLDPQTESVTIRTIGPASEDWRDERGIIDSFFRFVSGDTTSHEQQAQAQTIPPRLVSWNGVGFDLPVLRYRAMMLGVAASPGFYRFEEDRRSNDMHIDVMNMLSDHGASKNVGLGTLGPVLGLPAKSFLERPIYDHVLDGEIDRVTEYCKLDTIETLLMFLVWAFHSGYLSRSDLRRHVDAVRRSMSKLPYPGWRAIEATLEGWPVWAP